MWLTARLQADDKILTPPTIFLQDLIEKILPESSKLKPLKKRQSNTFTYCLSLMMLTGILIWFIYSADRSYHLIQPVAYNDSLNVLAKKMLVNETRAGSFLTYFPFSWALNYQHKQLSAAMAKKNINAIFDVQTVLKQIRDDIERLPVSRKRDRIIELAYLINAISDIQKDASKLKTDNSLPDIVLTNLYGDKTNTHQPEQSVIARHFLMGREGDKYIRSLQNTLKKFIVRDAFPQWFFVPHKSLNDISSSRYWPDMPEESELSGIWTRDGEKQIAKWVETLKAAADNETGIILDKMYHDLPQQRQRAWKAWLFNTNTSLKRQQGMKLTSAELLQIIEGKSPSFRLIDSVVKDLETVPDELTQPWLRDFRHVQHISSFASPTQNALPFFRADQKLHHRVSTYFKDDNSPASPKVLSQIDTFIAWREAVNHAADSALHGIASGSRSDNPSASLAVNKLSDDVLATLFSRFVKLQESFRGEESMQDREMLWGLLENDAHRLVGNGLYDIGCWLNQEWKKSVYWPAIRPTKNQEYNALLEQAWSSILDFLKGPAKGMLTYETQGLQGRRFYNETLPYAPDFLELINDYFTFAFTQDDPDKININGSDRQAVLEEKIAERLLQQNEIGQGIQPVNIVSLPVSLPDPGRVLPVGINLSLICENGVTSFDSINFAQTHSFTWYPGKCRRVTLSVKFPGFTADYSYSGHSAWPDFINEFISGEALIERERFTRNRKSLEEMNIDNILIRYQLDNIDEQLDSWAQWRQLEDEIIALKSERLLIMEARDQKPWRALKGKVSALPENITYCE